MTWNSGAMPTQNQQSSIQNNCRAWACLGGVSPQTCSRSTRLGNSARGVMREHGTLQIIVTRRFRGDSVLGNCSYSYSLARAILPRGASYCARVGQCAPAWHCRHGWLSRGCWVKMVIVLYHELDFSERRTVIRPKPPSTSFESCAKQNPRPSQ